MIHESMYIGHVELLAGITYLIFTPVDEIGFLELQFSSHLPNTQFTLVRNYSVSQVREREGTCTLLYPSPQRQQNLFAVCDSLAC